MNLILDGLIKHMENNAVVINSFESYSNLPSVDSSNLSTVKVGEILERLAYADVSVLNRIISVNGKARYDKKDDIDAAIETRVLIWFMFKFEQDGRQIKVTNLSLGTSFLANSMTAARQIIRETYR